jgi:uncharacterized protein YbaP (TraB family)
MQKRTATLFLVLLLITSLNGLLLPAQNTPPRVAPTEKPFLWRIEGPVPSYLYGTVHVPDTRVLELPAVVRRAFDASDVFNAEIPLDSGTQVELMQKIMLPPGQDLRKVAGSDLFDRVVRAITKSLGTLPAGAADIFATTLAPMKPWAAMSQLELMEYLPDLMAGRQPLDAMLYTMAQKANKEVGSLETVDEQVAVFDNFTIDEQVRMLTSVLDEIEQSKPGSASPTREVVELYLAGDLEPLVLKLNEDSPDDPVLQKKITKIVVDDRNLKMVQRIADRCRSKPAKSYFFAVGALHYAGETGIIDQLKKKGFKITRLTSRDANSIARRPAA